ncbi:F-box/kelch-repeat protein At1g80440-like [Phragmites australis]|uniref:F-box/kelch-repeat protein At1g80440-like n=1 Tax=Phragmites australis TaxID=29695 RepID=UPI002D77CBD5|nr:F-box/kelch-repeat protein At1g80440-like [Phragmites australis]
MDDLIPGLPEDLARECLVRVGFEQLPVARCVSRKWKAEVESPFHHSLRRPRRLLAFAQARPPLADSGPAHKYAASAASSYRLVLHDPDAGTWATLPPPLPGGLSLFCQLAAVGEGPGRKLVVLGGWDPETWAPTGAVYVYDFLAGCWRRGAEMPGPRRSFFACAADAAGGRVFVAGGHDEEKNALRSAAAYDAEADTWVPLPDMARERDEARGLFVGGRFLVLGGYPTEAQGRFAGSGEAFDAVAWSWGAVQESMLEEGACPRTCCAAPSAARNRMYMLRDGQVVARELDGGAWRQVARVPEDGRAVTAVAAIGDGRVVVVGSACHGAEQAVYVLSENEARLSWARAPAPPEFAGHIQAACSV